MDSFARVLLLDGDIVQVLGIGEVRRNIMTVSGQVYQPGEYELRPGMTLGSLIGEWRSMSHSCRQRGVAFTIGLALVKAAHGE